MRARGLAPGVKEYTACVGACAWASQSEAALEVLEMMGHDGVEADSFTYAAVLAACARAAATTGSLPTRCSLAKQAAAIVEELRITRPDIFANQHVLTEAHRCMMACGEWEAGDTLMNEMRASGSRLAKVTAALVTAQVEREAELKRAALTAEENAALCDEHIALQAEKRRWRSHKRRSLAKRREEPHVTIDAIDLPECSSAYSDLSALATAASTIDWSQLPPSLDPACNGFVLRKKRSAGTLQPDVHRAQRKRWQVSVLTALAGTKWRCA